MFGADSDKFDSDKLEDVTVPHGDIPREEYEQITALLRERDLRALREYLSNYEPAILADYITAFEVEEAIVMFRILPRHLAADIFEFLPRERQTELLSSLSNSRVVALLDEMAADDRTALFEEMPAVVARSLVDQLSPKERIIALTLLGYPERSIGRLMTPEYLSVRMDWQVEHVLRHIRLHGIRSESIQVLYVLGEKGNLLGQVNLLKLLTVDPDTSVSTLITEGVLSLQAYDDQEEAVRVFTKYGISTLPVVDSEGKLLGIVTIDDVLTVAQDEATEDIQKLGGVEGLEGPYLETPFLSFVRSRASWLVVLFLGEMLTASAMARYEHQLNHAVVLALFLPLIISSGGNSGSQAATVVIRALSIGEIKLSDWRRIFMRELGAGLLLGSILAVVGLARVLIWGELFGSYGDKTLLLGYTVSLSLLFVVLWGTLSGAIFPLILKRCGADPATSSAPFVATLVDVIGLIVYFTIAGIILGI